jgi:predicted transcriptional regulator
MMAHSVIAWKSCPHCDGAAVVWDDAQIGGNLQAVRQAAKVTLREVAELMNLSIGHISDLEHGRKRWTTKKVNFYLAAVETAKAENE